MRGDKNTSRRYVMYCFVNFALKWNFKRVFELKLNWYFDANSCYVIYF
jgi:hypothetical protein